MMLLDTARAVTVDGVTALPDHLREDTYWYLPSTVALAHRGPDKKAQLTLVLFKPSVATAESKGRGFLVLEAELTVPARTLNRLRAAVAAVTGVEPVLVPVPFEKGAVSCMALDLEGPGGTVVAGDQPGTYRVTEQILGARTPMLTTPNSAAFSLALTQEGATIMREVFSGGGTPVGVLYTLTYRGLRSALNVEITADLDRVYDHFSASIEGQYAWLKGSVEAALDYLEQEGAISIKAIDFTGTGQTEHEKWARDFFANSLLETWFEPTFLPAQAATGVKVPTVAEVRKAAGPTPGTTPEGGPVADTDPGVAPTRPSAVLAVTGREPVTLPAGLGLTHTAAAAGTAETMVVTGAGAAVRVDGAPHAVAADGRITLEVAPGTSRALEVRWPGSEARSETFQLFFDYDEPASPGFAVMPPSKLYTSYVDDSVADDRFKGSHAPSGNSASGGAAALRAWLTTLAEPRTVEIAAQASYEGHGTVKAGHNQALSTRRMLVARGIVANLAKVGAASATGQDPASGEVPLGDPDDRVAKLTGVVDAGRPAATLSATLSRAAVPAPLTGEKPPTGDKPPVGEKPPAGGDTPPAGGDQPQTTPAALAFKLKFVHQEERKRVTVRYDRQEAVERVHAPQGPFGLLLSDIADLDRHVFEVDGDDSFFRVMEITVDAPTDLGALGIASAQVAIDYGADGAPDHRHADAVFTPADHQERHMRFFLNSAQDTNYRYGVQYHFGPAAGWDGADVLLDKVPEPTSDRTLLLNPFEDFEFIVVEVEPGRIDADLVRSVDVELATTDRDGSVIRRTLTVRPGGESQMWRVRTDTLGDRSYTVRTTTHLAGGTARVEGPVTTTSPLLSVDDPFDDALEIELVPLFDPAVTRMCIADIEYEDPPNAYLRRERLTVNGDARDPAPLRIALLDPMQRAFRYRLTAIGTDGSVRRDAFVTTTDTLVVAQ